MENLIWRLAVENSIAEINSAKIKSLHRYGKCCQHYKSKNSTRSINLGAEIDNVVQCPDNFVDMMSPNTAFNREFRRHQSIESSC